MKKMYILIALVVVGLVIYTFSSKASGEETLFSAVSGRVLQEGKPVAGAVVERQFEWNNEKTDDRVNTTEDGSFSMPAVTSRSSFIDRLLPSEPMVKQTILITYEGKTHQAWFHFKRNYDDNGELAGKPIRLVCRLEATPKRQGDLYGICDVE